MYKVRVLGHFSSAHMLRQYKGKCEELHGHNWKVEVTVSSEKLNDTGMVIDFKELKEQLKKVLDTLDHKMINDIPYFKKVNPTSENIAKYIFDRLQITENRLQIKSVTLWETDTSCAAYSE